MNTCVLSLVAQATGEGLHLEIKLNNQTKYSQVISEKSESIDINIDDSADAVNVLEIIMSGKKPEHTVLDESGAIVKDRLIEISNVSLDGIELGQLFLDKVTYTHDFNGTAEKVQDQFFGKMGCNGSLHFEFSSPVYIWLLENM